MASMALALLVVDMQNEFFAEPAGLPSLAAASEEINRALALCRRHAAPVIVVLDAEAPSRLPGQESFEPHAGLHLEATDVRVHKQFPNSFWRTELDDLLRSKGVDTVVVTGWCAEFCVLSTYRGGIERGYRTTLLSGAIASDSGERLAMVEQICAKIDLAELDALLRRGE